MRVPAYQLSAQDILAADARRARLLLPLAVAAAGAGGILAGKFASSRQPLLIFALAGVFIPVLIWKKPQAGVVMLLGGATLIEQFTYVVNTHKGTFTDRIPLFASIAKGSGISIVELLIGLVVVIWIMRGALVGHWDAPRSPVSRMLVLFTCLVFVAVGVGMAHGGKFQIIMYEVRPWLYIGISYLLAASLLRTQSALRAVLWTLVLGTGFKALQGIQMYILVRHDPVRPDVLLAHEESFFFGLFLILTLGLWLFDLPGGLRRVATVLSPLVLFADAANARRTAWAIIGTTFIVFFFLAYAALPERRRRLRRLGVGVLCVSAIYFPVFWSSAGLIGQPARALHSQISPDRRDLSSNLYRVQENANLALNIRQTHSLGKGFGTLINYQLTIVDISQIDPFIKFLPHNGVLDLWMRLGIQGMVVFLMLLATVIIRASALLRNRDREQALIGALVVCAVVAYVVQGYNDMGFFWFRMALCLGTLIGTVEAAHRLAAAETPPDVPERAAQRELLTAAAD